jgi:hypothetical protein
MAGDWGALCTEGRDRGREGGLLGSDDSRQHESQGDMIDLCVIHGHLAFSRHPVLVGHYIGDAFAGTEARLDRALKFRFPSGARSVYTRAGSEQAPSSSDRTASLRAPSWSALASPPTSRSGRFGKP